MQILRCSTLVLSFLKGRKQETEPNFSLLFFKEQIPIETLARSTLFHYLQVMLAAIIAEVGPSYSKLRELKGNTQD